MIDRDDLPSFREQALTRSHPAGRVQVGSCNGPSLALYAVVGPEMGVGPEKDFHFNHRGVRPQLWRTGRGKAISGSAIRLVGVIKSC
jgi:hypothetical protein